MVSTVKLAVAPIAWSNDDLPALGGDTPLITCLAESRAAGFCGTELGGKFPRDVAQLKPLLHAHQLQLASGWFSGLLRRNDSPEEEIQRMRQHLEIFAALDTRVLFYADTTDSVQSQREIALSKRPKMEISEFARYGEKLTTLAARMLTEYGVQMAYHHHMGTLIETQSEVDLLMENSGEEVGLLVDSGHIVFAGGSPAALLRRYAARVHHIHCKDVRRPQLEKALSQDTSFAQAVLDGVFTVPGDGFIDFDDILSEVAKMDYHGWLVVEAEQDPARANPLTYSRMGGQHLRECCARAGIVIIDE